MPVSLFQNKGFQLAILITLLWHLFWFFGITIEVSPDKTKEINLSDIHFLGPVLTDESFNLIVSTKPELSRSIYQSHEPLGESLEPEVAQLERVAPGDLVSVPFGAKRWSPTVLNLEVEKPYAANTAVQNFNIRFAESPFPIKGDLAARQILELPRRMPMELDEKFFSDAEYTVTVNAQGFVVGVETVLSAGSVELDGSWSDYFREWQFMPDNRPGAPEQIRGTVTIDLEEIASP